MKYRRWRYTAEGYTSFVVEYAVIRRGSMEHFAVHAFMLFGIVAILSYLFFVFVKKPPSFKPISRVVVTMLVVVAIIGALIPISQFNGEELTFWHFGKVVYIALGLPGIVVGMAIFRVLLSEGPAYFLNK